MSPFHLNQANGEGNEKTVATTEDAEDVSESYKNVPEAVSEGRDVVLIYSSI